MKIKYISILSSIVVVVLLGVSFAQASGSSYTFTQNLTIGSAGADVIALQQLLINDGYLTSVTTPTGYFGYGTQVALGKLQAANGISPASGYGGAKTRAFLNTLGVSSSQPTSAVSDQENQPVAKNNNQICQNQYGANSDYTGANNSQGGLICGCERGYQWNSNQTACVAAENGYQVCSNDSSNATWNGTYLSNGSYDCVCDSGYVVNSNQTGCVAQSQVSINTDAPSNSVQDVEELQTEYAQDLGRIGNTPGLGLSAAQSEENALNELYNAILPAAQAGAPCFSPDLLTLAGGAQGNDALLKARLCSISAE
jgi:peptidoglycan hydrolase-like protein with peptidoglycan-binding domain